MSKKTKASEWVTIQRFPSKSQAALGAVKEAEGITSVVYTSEEEQWQRARDLGANVEFKKKSSRTPRNKGAELDRMINKALRSGN
jgi:hypothetical protein